MEWFRTEFSRSNIISGVLALAIWAAVIYLAVVQAPIPDILYVGGTSVLAFHFGAKVGQREGMGRAADIVYQREKGG